MKYWLTAYSASPRKSMVRWNDRCAVSNVSNCRCRGREFDPVPVPYFCGDRSWNSFYGHSPPFCWFKKVVFCYKGKYVQEVLVNCLVKLVQEKSMVRWTQDPDMTIAVDWDVKHQTKQANKLSSQPCLFYTGYNSSTPESGACLTWFPQRLPLCSERYCWFVESIALLGNSSVTSSSHIFFGPIVSLVPYHL